MFLNSTFPYPKSIRNNLLTAMILGFVVVFITIFLQPFGSNNFLSPYKNLYFTGYGLILVSAYLSCFYVADRYYQRVKVWKWTEELVFNFIYIVFGITLAFLYTELVINKAPDHVNLAHYLFWLRIMFLGYGTIMMVTTLLLRHYLGKIEVDEIKKTSTNVVREIQTDLHVFKSSLKNESFEVNKSDIIYIKSEDNYVKIFYLGGGELKEKMMRNTLSALHNQLPSLLRVHRSYLVNPNYIGSLDGNSQNARLSLTHKNNQIPVSKTYFAMIKSHIK